MKKWMIFSIIMVLAHPSQAQYPPIDKTIRQQFFQKKSQRYHDLLICEQQRTDNQDGYDVTYYSLDLIPDPVSSTLEGVVEVHGRVTASSINHIELNFYDGMTITDVHHKNNPNSPLNYSRGNDILSIQLGRNYIHGEMFSISITYDGRPQDSELYGWGFGFSSHAGQPMIWSFSQPWGARAWWPCKDIPSDKADSVDIRVTVPNNLIVASNGSLKGVIDNGSKSTYWWHEQYPIATYLVSVAIYPYDVQYDDYIYNSGEDTMKIHFYTFPNNWNRYESINLKVKDMISYFSDVFGEYPFIEEKYGHADFTEGGAIEHQTCTSFHFWNEWVYAHELAHQWWGDMVTYENWQHTWIGEGFATYSEALWYEHLGGEGAASEYQMTENVYYGPGTIFVEDPQTQTPFHLYLVYWKASWVLHMLRHVVGDDHFFQILKTFRSIPQHAYGTATTEEFRDICEIVSGIDLDRFFDQWIYQEYFPRYTYSWDVSPNGSGYDIQLTIQQRQGNPVFWMPIDVTVASSTGEETFVVWDSLKTQTFSLYTTSSPTAITLDKDNWILKQIEETFTDPTFDQGILLVNGVSWNTYGQEIINAYESRAFWGDFPISFWDCFSQPSGGYPSPLPEPLGFGHVPVDILSRYSTVIWIGNNYQGDIESWLTTSILLYLEAGGNVLLLSRYGQDFVTPELAAYLGISWREETDNFIRDCVTAYPGLVSMDLIGDQNQNAVFDIHMTQPQSSLLFKETTSFLWEMGLGVWHKPLEGGTYNENGGQFAFVSGRPYRYHAGQLRSNCEYILEHFFQERKTTRIHHADDRPECFQMEQNYPNPFNINTSFSFYLPEADHVRLDIFNTHGQLIKTLIRENRTAGPNSVQWDGTDGEGKVMPSGVYFYRLQFQEKVLTKKALLLK